MMLTKEEIETVKRIKNQYIKKAVEEDYSNEHTLDVCISTGIILERIHDFDDEYAESTTVVDKINAAKRIHVQMRRLEELLEESDEGD